MIASEGHEICADCAGGGETEAANGVLVPCVACGGQGEVPLSAIDEPKKPKEPEVLFSEELVAVPDRAPDRVIDTKQKRKDTEDVGFTSEGGFQLETLADALAFADLMLMERMIPEHYKTRGQVVAAIQAGGEAGLKPMQSLKHIAMIHGTPTIWGEAAKGLVEASGLLTGWRDWWTIDGEVVDESKDRDRIEEYPDSLTAHTRMHRKGGATVERSFSVGDAKKGNIWAKRLSPWITYPKRMLRVRAMSWAMRDLFADALGGLSIREEQQDIDPAERAAFEGGVPVAEIGPKVSA
jgi:hypothetical protein